MRRSMRYLLLLAVVLAGCRTQAPSAVDPFFGRTRVVPPRTGAGGGHAAIDPYFSGVRQATTPPAPMLPPQVSPGAGFKSDSASWSAATSSAVAATVSPNGSGQQAQGPLSGRERIVRTIEPRRMAAVARPTEKAAATSTGNPPGRLVLPERVIDIMALPNSRTLAVERPSADSGFRLVSGTSPATVSAATRGSSRASSSGASGTEGTVSFSPTARYGHDPEHRWLKGRLEYSAVDHRWKLRYIPIDGRTDEFGGSVVLDNASRLSGFERGDFVEVHGQINRQGPDDRGYAPLYKVARIKRLGQ